MNSYSIFIIGSLIGFPGYFTLMYFLFRFKQRLVFSIVFIIIVSALFFGLSSVVGLDTVAQTAAFYSLLCILLSVFLYDGPVVKKIFFSILNLLIAVFCGLLAAEIALHFFSAGSNRYITYFTLAYLIMFALYLVILFLTWRRISRWINTSYEPHFARNMISASRDHFEKMNTMYEEIRTLRHDYKYHLNTLCKLAATGDIDNMKQYLSSLQMQIFETEPDFYCNNCVINALLSQYAERCAKEDIAYSVQAGIPKVLSISDYELCIILGNLLENALEACTKLESGRYIELSIRIQGTQLGIMVKNSYNGMIIAKHKQPFSVKNNGGFGMKSVQAVADRYDGHAYFDWDESTFTVYVMLKL